MSFLCCCCRSSKKDQKDAVVFDDYKESFKFFDKDADGKISKAEILRTFKEMNLPFSETEADELMAEFDQNGDGVIEFEEFCQFMKKYLNADATGASAMFKYFDIDDDGYITVNEFVLTMRFLGEELTMEDADRVLGPYYKEGGDKKISCEEFKNIIRAYM